MHKNPYFWSTLALAIILIVYYLNENGYFDKGVERVTYKLPTDSNPDTFGKFFWFAFHDLAHRIPCGACRGEAESFMRYFHDKINLKTGKKLFDESNYNIVKNKICNDNSLNKESNE